MRSSFRYWLMIMLLAFSGIGILALSHGEAVVLNQPLSAVPLRLDSWSGANLPIEQRIVDAVAVDDYLNRSYVTADSIPVFAYVGYYRSQRTGQTIHSPRNCLPGSGWQPVRSGRLEIMLDDGRKVPVNLYVVEKGLNRLLVLYWYQSHGRIVASEYWGKYYLISDAIRLNRTDAALVRLSTVIYPDENVARERVVTFAKRFITELNNVSPD